MLNFFLNILTRVSAMTGFSFMLYNADSGVMVKYKEGKSEEVGTPEVLKEFLADENAVISSFSKDGALFIVYFLRFTFDEERFVVVINDSRARKHLNLFFSALSACCVELEEKNKLLNDSVKSENIPLTSSDNDNIKSSSSEPNLNTDEIVNKISELELSVKNKENETLKLKADIDEKNKQLDTLSFDLEELQSLVKIVKKSRDKHCALIDGLFMPMYSLTHDMKIIHANKALAEFIGVENVSKVIGKYCYEAIFNMSAKCRWCKKDEIENSKSPLTIEVSVERSGKSYALDVTGFPIIDDTDEIIEYGEFIADETDKVEMALSLNKFREQLKSFKRAKINDMNEVQDVKKAYDELSVNYDIVVERNNKLTRAMESVMAKDSFKEVLSAKAELVDYKHRLARVLESVKNYQKTIGGLQEKYADLNKRLFFQMERLINTLNSKQNIATNFDLKGSLDNLHNDFLSAKEFLMPGSVIKVEDKEDKKASPETEKADIDKLIL